VELISLTGAVSSFPTAASSSGTRSTAFSSSRKESTKPTSAGTSYPVERYHGKGKAIATYPSSVSATQGSASEAEADVEAFVNSTLVGVGDWATDSRSAAPPLKGGARARKRTRRSGQKKPPVVVHNGETECTSGEEYPAVAKPATHRSARGKAPMHDHVTHGPNVLSDVTYLRRRRASPGQDGRLDLSERARLSEQAGMALPCKPLSRARFYILISLISAIVLTFALSTFAAHHTGKMRMRCTKGIIFSASVLMSCFTILAMVVARQSLQTALLAGLLEFAIGFGLVVEIHDFM